MGIETLLNHFERHVKLDQVERDQCAQYFHPITVKKKDFLLRAGQVARYETFVIKGCFRTYTIDKEGN